jgi:hypothetical protein
LAWSSATQIWEEDKNAAEDVWIYLGRGEDYGELGKAP